MRNASIVVLACVLSLLSGGTVVAAEPPSAPSFLPFEVLFTTDNPPFTSVHCDQEGGSSSFEYTASGDVMGGPYLGTFRESGRVTIGPQSMPGPTGIPVFSGQTTSWSADFEIVSPLGTVRGTKWLVDGPNGFSRCVSGPPIVPEGNDDQRAGGQMRYAAWIHTSRGLFYDEGVASGQVSQCNCHSGGTISRFASFVATFRSDLPTAQRGIRGRPPTGD